MYSELAGKSAQELDLYLQTPEFRQLFVKLRKVDQQHVLVLLCRDRLRELSIRSRAALIKTMQVGATRKHHELAIRDIFLATEGHDLTRLKRAVDRGTDHRDLAQLLFHDIDIISIREAIIKHFYDQAVVHTPKELRILSDIDDTIYANWRDRRFPPKTVYPGVFQLYRELDEHGEMAERGDIVLLTGRASERSGTLENHYRRKMGALGAEEITMMTGTFVHQFVLPWVFARKWTNLERHRMLFPEVPLVLFGDTGQADPEFISQAVERYPHEVRAGVLHKVAPLPKDREERCLRNGIHLVDTYVGAAVHLLQKGLLTPAALARVVEAAHREFAKIKFVSEEQRSSRRAELERDLAIAQEVLPS